MKSKRAKSAEKNGIKNWLTILCDEFEITPYQIVKNAKEKGIDGRPSNLYHIIYQNKPIFRITLETMEVIAAGLGYTNMQFLTKVYNRFK